MLRTRCPLNPNHFPWDKRQPREIVANILVTEKYYAHLAPNNLSEAVRPLEGALVRKSLPHSLPNCTKTGNSEAENPKADVLLTHSSARCYFPKVPLLAGVAKLAYAADSSCGRSERGRTTRGGTRANGLRSLNAQAGTVRQAVL